MSAKSNASDVPMFEGTSEVQDTQRKRQEFLKRAEDAFDRMMGPGQQKDLVTLAQREQRACEVTDELARWLMTEQLALLESAAPGGPPAADGACPVCQGPLEPRPAQEREVVTRRGRIRYKRSGGRCRRCRRIFFPPG